MRGITGIQAKRAGRQFLRAIVVMAGALLPLSAGVSRSPAWDSGAMPRVPSAQTGAAAMDGLSYTVYRRTLLNTEVRVQQDVHVHLTRGCRGRRPLHSMDELVFRPGLA
ncbi:hypothetical protein [Dyella sp. ASV21]|uniref:hypothetical protein n=1 Tax=Dyella sp. ASV21 TaxID=2795114 RepID=UPI0018ED6803|nr:hypothetical protein [Dyella sp. ASV21]